MNEFTSIHDVSFPDILKILQQWETGILQFDKVQAWAEAIIVTGWYEYDKDDPRSLLAQVIAMLDDMYIAPIQKRDSLQLQHILQVAIGSPKDAWHELDEFVKSVDWNQRKAQASKNIHKYQSPLLDT